MADKQVNIILQAVDKATSTIKGVGGSLSNFAKNNEKSFKSMATYGAAGFSAIIGGATAAAVSMGKTADKILDLEQITGLSTDTLQEFEAVTRVAGVGSDAFARAVSGLSRRFKNIEKEGSGVNEAMSKLGVSIKDTNGDIKDMDSILMESLSGLSSVENTLERNALANEIFGRSYEDLIPIMALGADGIDEIRQSAHDMGQVMSKEGLESANEFRIAQEQLTASLSSVKDSIAVAVIPILMELVDFLQPIIQSTIQWLKANPELAKNILLVSAGVAGLVAVIGTLGLVLPAIIAGFGLLISPIGLVVVALGLLTAAFATNFLGIRDAVMPILDHIIEILRGFGEIVSEFWLEHGEVIMFYVSEFLGFLRDTFEAVFVVISEIVKNMLTIIGAIFKNMFELFSIIINAFRGDRDAVFKSILAIGTNSAQAINEVLTNIFGETRENITDGLGSAYDYIVAQFTNLIGFIDRSVERLKGLWQSAKSFLGGGGGGARALGGPVQAGRSYLVGERGPEMFTPATSGSIDPKPAGGSTININMGGVTVNNEADEQRLVESIYEMFKRENQLYQLGIN